MVTMGIAPIKVLHYYYHYVTDWKVSESSLWRMRYCTGGAGLRLRYRPAAGGGRGVRRQEGRVQGVRVQQRRPHHLLHGHDAVGVMGCLCVIYSLCREWSLVCFLIDLLGLLPWLNNSDKAKIRYFQRNSVGSLYWAYCRG